MHGVGELPAVMLEEAEWAAANYHGEAALLELGDGWGCLLWYPGHIPVAAFSSDLFAMPWLSDDCVTLH